MHQSSTHIPLTLLSNARIPFTYVAQPRTRRALVTGTAQTNTFAAPSAGRVGAVSRGRCRRGRRGTTASPARCAVWGRTPSQGHAMSVRRNPQNVIDHIVWVGCTQTHSLVCWSCHIHFLLVFFSHTHTHRHGHTYTHARTHTLFICLAYTIHIYKFINIHKHQISIPTRFALTPPSPPSLVPCLRGSLELRGQPVLRHVVQDRLLRQRRQGAGRHARKILPAVQGV